jgi:hypothetical protein
MESRKENRRRIVNDLVLYFDEFVPEVYVSHYGATVRGGKIFWLQANPDHELTILLRGVTDKTWRKLVTPRLREWRKNGYFAVRTFRVDPEAKLIFVVEKGATFSDACNDATDFYTLLCKMAEGVGMLEALSPFRSGEELLLGEEM